MDKTAVILCGGQGVRLRPYTITIPKPLMPLGDRSILDIVVEYLKRHGFQRLIFAVNYQSQLIKAYFQDGARFGVHIEYIEEDEPLGTIGPLRNIVSLPDKFLVMNGDILTDMNLSSYFDMFDPKLEFALVPTYKKKYNVDFGVIQRDEKGCLASFEEKPQKDLLVSMGIYFFTSRLQEVIPPMGSFGFDALMHLALQKNLKISCPVYEGKWLDIGRHEDYAYAQDHYRELVKL